MKKLLKFLRIIGVLILIYILSTLQYEKLFDILKNINIFYLMIYMMSYYIYFWFKVLRFSYILRHYGYNPAKFDIFGATIESQYFGFITPSRIGESVKVVFLEGKTGIPKRVTIMTYIYDRFQDLYFMALMGVFSFVFILKLPANTYLIIFTTIMVFLFFIKNPILKKFAIKFKIEQFEELTFKSDFYLFVQNCIIYSFYFLQYYFLALSLGVDINFFYLSAITVVGALATLLPISISGLGVREGVFVYYLVKIGVTKEAAFLISFLDNFGFTIIFIVIMHIIYKFVSWRISSAKNI